MEELDDIFSGTDQQNDAVSDVSDILNDSAENTAAPVIDLEKHSTQPVKEETVPIEQPEKNEPMPVEQNVQEISEPTPQEIQPSVEQTVQPPQQNDALGNNKMNDISQPVQNNVPPVNNSYQQMQNSGSSFANSAQPMQNSPNQPDNAPRRPVYDKFMYEPIGFAGYNNRANIPPENAFVPQQDYDFTQTDPKKSEKMAMRLMTIILVICLIMSIFGIVYDVATSRDRMGKSTNQGIVIYSEKKPEGANDLDNFKDENGKYTTEGVAQLVRPSIVEIFVYSDPAHKELIGTGSGVVISKDGYIVTNAHVLQTNGYHTVGTIDEKTYSAKIVGRDAKTDIAVIKVNTNELTPATLGDSDEALVGEQVIAIGNPANLSSTVTDGIISAINRKIRGDSTGFDMECIQTNADISPGNSGGALVNMYGQVIGITSSKYVSSSFEGLGFAISINEVKPIVEELVKNGYMGGRFRIGIQLLDMSSAAKRKAIEEEIKQELPEDFSGIYISSISDDCDIANTDLEAGDFITEIDGKPVSTYDELYDTISSKYGAGDTVPAKCARLKKDGEIEYFNIKFKLMEDTSGDY